MVRRLRRSLPPRAAENRPLEAFAFEAVLVPYAPRPDWPDGMDGPVVRTIAVRDDQTLEHLHEALRLAFGWAEPHLSAFWMSGRWWDHEAVRYEAPFELDPDDERARSARTPLGEIGLRKGKRLSYVFDFGDEWRLMLRVVDRWKAGDQTYPMLLEAEGVLPPQYPPLEDDDLLDPDP
jgi:hypothetical protein